MTKDPQKNLTPYVAGIVILLLGALGIVFWPSGPTEQNSQSLPDPEPGTATQEPIISYTYLSPEAWDGTEQAERILNETQGKEDGEEMITFGIVEDPRDSNIVYFATYDDGEREDGSVSVEKFAGIYRYDQSISSWERLWRTSYTVDGPGIQQPTYHPIGYDDGKLIIREMDNGHLTEGCTRTRKDADGPEGDTDAVPVTGVGPLYAMNLAQPYDAWSSYEPDVEMVESLADPLATCFTANTDRVPS